MEMQRRRGSNYLSDWRHFERRQDKKGLSCQSEIKFTTEKGDQSTSSALFELEMEESPKRSHSFHYSEHPRKPRCEENKNATSRISRPDLVHAGFWAQENQ